MKRSAFIKILEDNEVVFFRHGSEHDIYINKIMVYVPYRT
jgi:hypothetical protein